MNLKATMINALRLTYWEVLSTLHNNEVQSVRDKHDYNFITHDTL